VVTSTFAERARASVQLLQPEEQGEWRTFAARTFGPDSRQADPAWFAWMAANPEAPPGGSQTWIARRNGDIVGTQGGMPFRLKEGRRMVHASWSVDLMVDPAWRLRGVGPALADAHLAANTLCGAVGVSDDAYRPLLRGGWAYLGDVPHYVHPIDIDWAIGSVPLGGATRVASRAIARPILGFARIWSQAAARVSGTRLEPIERFDARADVVWRRTAGYYPVIAARDRRALAWLFDAVPDAGRFSRYYLTHDRQVRGYVVTRLQSLRGRSTLQIVDYLVPPRMLLPLLGHVAALSDVRGAAAISCHTLNPHGDIALRVAGFIPVGSTGSPSRIQAGARPIRLMVYSRDARERKALQRVNWFLTSGDCDISQW
jgi:GNAT superfamily N-acetyltransferase